MAVSLYPGENARGSLIHVDRELSIVQASRLMSESGAEELLVTDQAEGALVAVGIVTARNIVTRVIAAGLDPEVLTAGDIAWSDAAGAYSGGCS
jgi:CBS domain-containing protein